MCNFRSTSAPKAFPIGIQLYSCLPLEIGLNTKFVDFSSVQEKRRENNTNSKHLEMYSAPGMESLGFLSDECLLLSGFQMEVLG
jgi:hypothetical protein